MSAPRIEAELRAFIDSFINLVRAARIGDDNAASKKNKVFQTCLDIRCMSHASCPSSFR